MIHSSNALFTVPLAEGGEAWYGIILGGITSIEQLKLSISGFYAPSRDAVTRKWTPAWLNEGLPPVQPVGFPVAKWIEIPEQKA